MQLFVLIIFATILYTLFDIFVSRAGNKIDPTLSASILGVMSGVLPLVVYAIYKLSKGVKLVATTGSGIMYSVLAGLAVGLFTILLVKIFEKGGLAYVVPLIYGGTVVLASLAGWLFFKESVSALQLAGVCIVVLGIALIVFSKMQVTVF